MAFFPKTFTALALAASIALPLPAAALDDQQKKEFGEFIKQYLIENPEIMLEVQDALQKKQEAQRSVKANMAIEENSTDIFESKNDVTLGNPKGDVTVVEFFDYNCSYCRHALPDMQAMLKKDKNVRFVLKEFPILGPDSVAAHKVADAFRKLAPEKYADFHVALLGTEGRASDETAVAVAASLGVSEDKIRAEMAKSPNDGIVQATYQLASSLGISGTPSYVIGNELVPGAVGLDDLEAKVRNMRSCGKTAC
ncbi:MULTISPECIES: DsbA family protein [Rhizobium]|uniref:DsbA family protein n=1 Tax=Rhizobium changzhiense TaxID=2692317 RepID=A0ABR6A9B3_9HYPH|nr:MULTISPECIES: DsbA family protein [Rhizobium]MBA5803210.1 DsbA family protein [Rhizobium changzhiense]MCV9943033.1 DsbA family protein [Rhizobium sp. BT-175]MCW0015057.1 DsbA family protein [Rhizobium sp. BT-226]